MMDAHISFENPLAGISIQKEEDVEKFVKAFQADFYCYEPTIKQEVSRQGMFNLIDNQTSLKVDFIVCKETLYRQTEFERRKKTNLAGKPNYGYIRNAHDRIECGVWQRCL